MASVLTARMPVRFADTDAQGVVYFANYLTYFDEALMVWFASAGLPWAQLCADGVDMVYVDAHTQYRTGSSYGEVLEIEVSAARFGNTSATWDFALRGPGGGELRVCARLVSVFIDAKSRRPVGVPAAFRLVGAVS